VTGDASPTYRAETARAAAVCAWGDKINAQPDAPHTLRDLAASLGLLADESAARAEARHGEPGEAYVTRLRPQHETSAQVSGPPGSWDFRYPARLTEPGARTYPPLPEPGVPDLRGQVRMLNGRLDQAGLTGDLDLAARFEKPARTVRRPRRSITKRVGRTVLAGPGPRGIRGATRRAEAMGRHGATPRLDGTMTAVAHDRRGDKPGGAPHPRQLSLAVPPPRDPADADRPRPTEPVPVRDAIAEYITKLVADAPLLPAEARAHLAALLTGTTDEA